MCLGAGEGQTVKRCGKRLLQDDGGVQNDMFAALRFFHLAHVFRFFY